MDWTVEDLGNGVHLFRWAKGFYISPFVVTTDGVVAFDPINRTAAAGYRDAVASVTNRPITHVVYSHDHRDHVVGADVLAPEAEIHAHELAKAHILRRGDPDIPVPHRTIAGGDRLDVGGQTIEFEYFGPNHSNSSLATTLSTGHGRLLVFVDVVEPGVAPYRNLPDTDFIGLVYSLDQATRLDFDLILGGHVGPGEKVWVTRNRDYLRDLLEATREAWAQSGGQQPLPGEDGVAMTERTRNATCRQAAEAVRSTYGHWRGFDEWAPQTADRILSYLIIGN